MRFRKRIVLLLASFGTSLSAPAQQLPPGRPAVFNDAFTAGYATTIQGHPVAAVGNSAVRGPRKPQVQRGHEIMSVAQPSQVFLADDGDPEMQRAYEQARGSFRYFWREIAWDRRRIVPALEMAAVKAPFTDDALRPGNGDAPEVEHMWLFDVDFDGEFVSGVLVNEPNSLTSVKAGDAVRVPLDRISDWMYVMDGAVYGAFTVNLLRSRMDPAERREHDEAWGLDFGDPRNVRMDTGDPHLMSETMASSLKEALANDPSVVSVKGHNGWTLLHQEASAGSAATVQVLLDAGADPGAKADNGLTPLQLANVLGWESVAKLLDRGQSGANPPPRPGTAAHGSNPRADAAAPARNRSWWRFWG